MDKKYPNRIDTFILQQYRGKLYLEIFGRGVGDAFHNVVREVLKPMELTEHVLSSDSKDELMLDISWYNLSKEKVGRFMDKLIELFESKGWEVGETARSSAEAVKQSLASQPQLGLG